MKNMNRNKAIAFIFLVIISVFTIRTLEKIESIVDSNFINKLLVVQVDENNNKMVTISNKLRGVIANIENTYNDNIFNKNKFIEINGYTQKCLDKNVIDDVEKERTVVKDVNNFLHFTLTEELIDISSQAKNITKLSEFCTNNNIKFMYVQAPFKVTGEKGQLPTGISDYSNLISDNLLKELEIKNISYLDLRNSMKKDSLKYEDVFFKTDHH